MDPPFSVKLVHKTLWIVFLVVCWIDQVLDIPSPTLLGCDPLWSIRIVLMLVNLDLIVFNNVGLGHLNFKFFLVFWDI